ncbi:MAG: TIR domain-containing protein [Actinomycetota bacterium]
MRIFLSHGSNNKAIVRDLRRRFPSYMDVWFDEESLVWSDDLQVELRRAIEEKSSFLIVFLDDEAMDRDWLVTELQWALDHEARLGRSFVLPVLVGQSLVDVPSALQGRRFLRLADQEDATADSLVAQIQKGLYQLLSSAIEESEDRVYDEHRLPQELVSHLADTISISGFRPDLLVGVARGGLVIAAELSQDFQRRFDSAPKIPVVGLWPHPEFENEHNPQHISVKPADPGAQPRVLIVDDVCVSGRTLWSARKYVQEHLDAPSALIETAVVSSQQGDVLKPTWAVQQDIERALDAAGEWEGP